MTQLLNVSVSDGKYTVIQEADGRLHALRYGEPWKRDLVGDKLVLHLAQELAEAREQLLWLQGDRERKDRYIAELRKTINPGADVPAMDPTGPAPGAYTDPGPLTAADLPNVRRAFAERAASPGITDPLWIDSPKAIFGPVEDLAAFSVARWPTLRDAKGKTFAERKAERTALLDQAKPATLEQAAEDAARMHSQMEADGTLRRAPLLDADFASLEARILASYHAAYPSLQALAKALKEAGKMSDEQFQQWLQGAAEHLRGQAPEVVAITPTRTETTADFARRVGAVPASERTAPNFHAQADHAARTPLFDPDKAVATFRKEIDMAVGTLLAKLNTKA